jgi:hypothetical protein
MFLRCRICAGLRGIFRLFDYGTSLRGQLLPDRGRLEDALYSFLCVRSRDLIAVLFYEIIQRSASDVPPVYPWT